MPLLWGLFALPTVLELGAGLAMAKAWSGIIGGMPGHIYLGDRVVRGLEYLRAPTDEELKANNVNQPGTTKGKKEEQVAALACAQVYAGQAFVMPFFSSLACLVNAAVLLVILAAIRAVWTSAVYQTPPPLERVPSLYFAPADFAAGTVFVISVTLLCGLQHTCYSYDDTAGRVAVFTALASAMLAFGVVVTEEVSFLSFDLRSSYNAFVRHESVTTSGWWWFLPPYPVAIGAVFLLCVAVSFGTSTATWRLIRCHYQLQDRYAQRMRELEEKRASHLINYKLSKVQNQPQQSDLNYSQAAFYWGFVELACSWATVTAPIFLAATFVVPSFAAHPDVAAVRLFLSGAAVATRVWLLRSYLQTYLLRDTSEAVDSSNNTKNWVEKMQSVSARAKLLLPRTALLLLAPATALASLSLLSCRLGNEVWSHWVIGDILGSVIPASLISHEYRAAEAVPPVVFWRQLLSVLTFWLCGSEAVFVVVYAGYRWFMRCVFRNNRDDL